MEQKHTCGSICDQLPTLSANHPWLVDHDQNLDEDNRDHIIYTIRDPLSRHRCRIPSSHGRRMRGCFHGWVILSNHPKNDMLSLWNPVTSKIIRLPRLHSKDITQECCLSSPPDSYGSVFMVTKGKDAILFCRLDRRRKRYRWVEMSYAKQMRSIAGFDGFLHSLTCCNGKVYALNNGRMELFVIHIDIAVKGTEIVISLLPYLKVPSHQINDCFTAIRFLIGCCTELIYIELGLNKVGCVTKETVGGVCVSKLDMTNIRWEEMKDLKDTAFFLDLAHGNSAFYSPAIGSELGGYVHYLERSGKVIHSYDFNNKTIALSSLEMRLQDDHGKIKCRDYTVSINSTRIETHDENMGSRLLSIPFDVLKMIMEFCVGVEYLNFRATCKQCHLAAPMIRWSKVGRLPTYSLASPWLMVLDKDRGVISFTDPMFGDKYFIKTPQDFIGNVVIHCSMYGWLLIRKRNGPLMFFNPFTSDIRELPQVPYLDTYCFSAPPTSSDCMVFGVATPSQRKVYIHFVAREPFWYIFHISFCEDDVRSFHFATQCGQKLYALCYKEGLGIINTDNQHYKRQQDPRSSCKSTKQNFLMKCDQQLLLVIMGEFGESVEIFKMNVSTKWEKIKSLGRHVIYICGNTCLCIEAKMPEMANKIYFPRLHSENRMIVFYSLETSSYHTSNVEGSFGDFMGTEHHLNPHVWIEPSWS